MAKKLPRVGEWYIEQRARSLATIYLTRRDDLIVMDAAEGGEVDLQVVIKTRKEAANRKFGVILKGTRNERLVNQANAILRPIMEALSTREFPYPVCLFFFRMDNDEGFYTWVAEPVVTDDGSPVLHHRNEAACRDLDTNAINEIVESVSEWYDAFSASVMEGARGRRKKSGIEVLHGIIDGEAAYFAAHNQPPKLLKLPIVQAYELAKLGREHLGDLAGQIMKEGVRVLQRDGLLGLKVKLVNDQQDFSFE
jgi:hypothetical protein